MASKHDEYVFSSQGPCLLKESHFDSEALRPGVGKDECSMYTTMFLTDQWHDGTVWAAQKWRNVKAGLTGIANGREQTNAGSGMYIIKNTKAL